MSNHAVERYVERVRPTLDLESARGDLIRLLNSGAAVIEYERPAWCGGDDEPPADWFLLVADSFACPVRNGCAITVMARGTVSEGTRAYRKQAKKNRHGIHRAQKVGERTGVQRRQRKDRGRRERFGEAA